MKKIFWKDGVGSLYKGIPADKVVEELEKISSDAITPEQVLNVARNENSILHNLFEWNDSVAAEKYRIIQAQQMLVKITYVEDENDTPKRYYHNVTYSSHEYHPVDFIYTHEDSYELLKKRAYDYLQSAISKYETVKEFQPVWDAIKKIQNFS